MADPERIVDVPPDLVWLAWTSPEHLEQWFCPRPWMTTECDIDLRPGGKFRTVMRGPEGQEHDNTGCYLEVVAPSRLVWTGALEPGFRPSSAPHTSGVGPFMAIITIEPHDTGTKYTATAMHRDPEGRPTRRWGFTRAGARPSSSSWRWRASCSARDETQARHASMRSGVADLGNDVATNGSATAGNA